jgi:hypothetical protein
VLLQVKLPDVITSQRGSLEGLVAILANEISTIEVERLDVVHRLGQTGRRLFADGANMVASLRISGNELSNF